MPPVSSVPTSVNKGMKLYFFNANGFADAFLDSLNWQCFLSHNPCAFKSLKTVFLFSLGVNN